MRNSARVVRWWCFLGLLAAGCSAGISSTPASYTATLTLLTLTQSSPTPTPALFLLRTPAIHPTSIRSTPPVLNIRPPDCYETPVGGMWCLGLIRNILIIPLEGVTVRVYLVTAEGIALSHRETLIARSTLPPGEMSPYGVFFESVPAGMVGPVATLVDAQQVSVDSVLPTLVARISMEDNQGALFYVMGEVHNAGSITTKGFELVITLFDQQDRVVGFRQWRSGAFLAGGETLPFELQLIPLSQKAIHAEVSVDGRGG